MDSQQVGGQQIGGQQIGGSPFSLASATTQQLDNPTKRELLTQKPSAGPQNDPSDTSNSCKVPFVIESGTHSFPVKVAD